MRPPARLFALVVVSGGSALAVACGRTAPTGGSAATTITLPVASAPLVPSACHDLAPRPCAEQLGCLLDQPAPGKYVCRAGKDACERAARHRDIIGSINGVDDRPPAARDAPAAYRTTADAWKKAVADCRAVDGCEVSSGKCSCACAVLGSCDCACGGGYLARCTTTAEAQRLDREGFPR